MKKNTRMHLVLCLLIVLCTACKKNSNIAIPLSETPPNTTIPPVGVTPTPTPIIPSYLVGTGSGNLIIDGKSLDLTSIKLIKVKAGSYTSITVSNITGTSATPISLKNEGQVTITGSMQTNNLKYVTIAGDNTPGIKYGFSFENISYRAISIHGLITGITLKSMSFKNVNDYVISGDNTNDGSLKYTGTSDTRSENFKILNCLFDNAGMITFGGNLNKDTGEDSGLFKDVEVAYNSFQNASPGSVCSFTNVQDYNIHNNVVNNINQSNNNHNGIFFMQGNGKFHDNKLTNYQGNSIRMWLFSRGSTPITVEIYNNVCYSTRKYGAFELQGFDRNIYAGKSTYANAKVYNNTVGRMNTSKDWEGQILDLYNYGGGTLEYYNNLGFDLNRAQGSIGNMINNMSDTKILKEENNKYFTSQSSAVTDLVSFISLITGIGASGL